MTEWKRVAGDTDTVVVKLAGVDSLATASAVAAYVQPETGGTWTTLSAAVTDAIERTVTVQLGTWLSAATAAGRYRLRTVVTFGAVGPLTWPSDDGDRIVVAKARA